MNAETEYHYKKRIRELERENNDLRTYKSVALRIFDNVCQHVQENTYLSTHWILRQFRDVMR